MGGGVCFGAFVLLAAFCSLSSHKAFPDIAAVSNSAVLCWDRNSLAKQRKPLIITLLQVTFVLSHIISITL